MSVTSGEVFENLVAIFFENFWIRIYYAIYVILVWKGLVSTMAYKPEIWHLLTFANILGLIGTVVTIRVPITLPRLRNTLA